MSEKVVRKTLESKADNRCTWANEGRRLSEVFDVGDKVVIILESEYERLHELAAMYEGLCK